MKPKTEEIIAALNKALALEYGNYIQMATQAAILTGLESVYLQTFFQKQADVSLVHAALLRDRIFFLGGRPTMDVGAREVKADAREAIALNLRQSAEPVAVYRHLLKLVPRVEGAKLFETLEHIYEDEQEDLEEFQRLANKIVA